MMGLDEITPLIASFKTMNDLLIEKVFILDNIRDAFKNK